MGTYFHCDTPLDFYTYTMLLLYSACLQCPWQVYSCIQIMKYVCEYSPHKNTVYGTVYIISITSFGPVVFEQTLLQTRDNGSISYVQCSTYYGI